MLPTAEQIRNWDDNRLKNVYKLLFEDNINPQLTETRKEVDAYLMAVDSEYEHRGFKNNLSSLQTLASKYREFLPLPAVITEEIIKSADIFEATNCIGAKTLKSAIEGKINPADIFKISWGSRSGCIVFTDNTVLEITTSESLNMMKVTEPTNVTFIIF